MHSKSLHPEWEEMLIFNEHPTHFVNNEKLIIFFEVLDFPTSSSMSITGHRHTRLDSSPWFKIAWAFVRPAGKIGKAQMGEKCRLQLFQYPRRRFRRQTEANQVQRKLHDRMLHSIGFITVSLYVLVRYTTCGHVDIVLLTRALSMSHLSRLQMAQ